MGSRNEHTGITGVSHLLEHMLFKGTQQYRLGEIARTLFLNGASFNASTYYDWTNYYETIAADRLELAMRIEADRMVNSRIDKADLDSEMTVVRSELEGGENSPGRLLWQAVASTAFQAHPYRWPVIGWRSDVENVSRDAIYQYYRTHYGPSNADVVDRGRLRTAAGRWLVRQHFGPIKPIPTPPRSTRPSPRSAGSDASSCGDRAAADRARSPRRRRRRSTRTSTHWTCCRESSARAAPAGSTRRSSRRGSPPASTPGSPSLRDPFLFDVTATARPGVTAEQLENAMLDEVERMKRAPITAEELPARQRRIEADFVFQTDSVTAQARQLGYWAMIGDWRYLTTYLDRVRALTAADIQAVAKKTFTVDTRTSGTSSRPRRQAGRAAPARGVSPCRAAEARGPTHRPSPRAGRAGAQPPRTRFSLDNGISVIVQENHATPTFALRASVPAGSLADPRDKPGLAGFTAAMLSRGTVQRSALGFATALEDVGAGLGAGADTLVTSVTGEALTRDFDLVLDLFAEMLRQPSFPAADFDRLKSEALAGIAQAKTNPDRIAGLNFDRAVYPPDHPLRPLTFEESEQLIPTITRDDLVDFHRRQYGPDRMIVVVTGDVAPNQVRDALQKRLGDWPRNPETRAITPPDLPLRAAPESIEIRVPDRSQASIAWGHAGGLRRKDPDFYSAQVMSLILGGGALTSRLSTSIRDEQGLAYSVYGYFDASLYPGPFRVGLGTNPANAKKAVAALESEIQRIRRDGVTQREVDEAVAYLTGRFPLRLETNGGRRRDPLGHGVLRPGGRLHGSLRGLLPGRHGPRQVNEAARAHLHPDRAVVVIAGPLP